jgi:hypothetical protein
MQKKEDVFSRDHVISLFLEQNIYSPVAVAVVAAVGL